MRKRFKVSRCADSQGGPKLQEAYEYYKSIHEANKERVLKVSLEIKRRSPRRYFVVFLGKKEEIPAFMAISFASREHILKAAFYLKSQNPKMSASLDEAMKKYGLELLDYIVNNLAENVDSWYKRSGDLIIG